MDIVIIIIILIETDRERECVCVTEKDVIGSEGQFNSFQSLGMDGYRHRAIKKGNITITNRCYIS